MTRLLNNIESGQIQLSLSYVQPFMEREGVELSHQKALLNVLRTSLQDTSDLYEALHLKNLLVAETDQARDK